MRPHFVLALTALGFSAPLPSVSAADDPSAPVDFARDVRPILAKNCFACHGPDDGHRARNLRLDRRDEALKARRKGTPVVPGQPDMSLVIARVSADDDTERMPPAETGNRLTPEQIDTLRRWIG